MLNVATSLKNPGILGAATGDYDSARALYREGADVCEQRLLSEPAAIVDLTHQQLLMRKPMKNGIMGPDLGLDFVVEVRPVQSD